MTEKKKKRPSAAETLAMVHQHVKDAAGPNGSDALDVVEAAMNDKTFALLVGRPAGTVTFSRDAVDRIGMLMKAYVEARILVEWAALEAVGRKEAPNILRLALVVDTEASDDGLDPIAEALAQPRDKKKDRLN